MNKVLIAEVAKRLKVSRQTRWEWNKGFSPAAKEYLAKHGTFISVADRIYFIKLFGKEYPIAPTLWGELKGLKELRASVKLLKDKERNQLRASVKTK